MPPDKPEPSASEFEFAFDFDGVADPSDDLAPKKTAPDTAKSRPAPADGDAVIRKRAGSASAKAVTPPASKPKPAAAEGAAPSQKARPPAAGATPPAALDARKARSLDGDIVVRKAKSVPKSEPVESRVTSPNPPRAQPSEETPPPPERTVPIPARTPVEAQSASPSPARSSPQPEGDPSASRDAVAAGGNFKSTRSVLPPAGKGRPFRPVPNPFGGDDPQHELDRVLEEEAIALPNSPREAGISHEPTSSRLDPTWDAPRAAARVGKRWIVAAVVLAALGGGAVFLIKGLIGNSDDENGGSGEGGGGAPAAIQPGGGSNGQPLAPRVGESLADIKSRIDDSLEKFFAASDPAGLLPFVRDRERCGQPLVEDYYRRHQFAQPELGRVGRVEEIMINLKTFWTAEVALGEGAARTVVLQDTDEGFVVDWETYVSYNPMAWDEFAKGERSGAMAFRVYATLDHKPGYAFPEPSKWTCVQLSSRGGDRVLYGYAAKGSEVALALEEMLSNEWEYPCILELEFPDDPKGGDDQVHIRRLVIEHWIMVNSASR